MATEDIKNESAAEVIVDETPISPVRSLDRRNSLEKHLQHRPEPQDLKNRHILLDTTTAPALQAKALELERQRATDQLKKGLNARPERADLIERNILPASNAAPALQGHQKELDMHMRADNLEKGLQARPSPEELVKKGILDEGEIGRE
ncbi:hypothetical protein J4E83_010569 [Alternaria metachromatica]|uniref:uncharacterized protein n=1 Tax=Alternaria metachromatica TaxID=283354 RepID=UPI0020C5336E|nr:uncharacterized protein J4E83_010569 [Alternaria metachromatica]XP_049218566.1 uncharacterized protein J4E78_009007 [Alternaria triticimaculans]XP_049238699.1 uncharacterized protein J4E84_011012 [Alternaria hordeiaustralica]KAI4605576.1 hypothetical protein J4E83_010569 [Alternaria metachromatica]KAI4647035.1 hypothetical protein J4E78_009007 [Alternaria triticimaculans]KAI4673486.1 hypothetical protein J4E84_011012 [Alternaria hordeiaustralica]